MIAERIELTAAERQALTVSKDALPEPAMWTDGEAVNLAAAAADALEWLQLAERRHLFTMFLRHRGASGELIDDSRKRLAGCIAALERLLPEAGLE